ncbi:hypothetical protein MVEN_00670000 [Mycena venus]|uniref:Uncharacterized protein n=1 Tax=Mycena venus TaxID=2733690 RepID=A0A8H7D6G5_9AGAR|nr:hypothetical protein MVEN_00670000 [Mycena venus]
MKLLDDIKHLDFAAYGQVFVALQLDCTHCPQTFGGVEPETWDVFNREHRESCDYKIKYLADDTIVACSSGVHESFTVFVQPFYKVVSTLNGMFCVEHNRDIRITSSSGSKRRSTRVPDFVFATDDTPPKYLFLLESPFKR